MFIEYVKIIQQNKLYITHDCKLFLKILAYEGNSKIRANYCFSLLKKCTTENMYCHP
jgi:hypothetical protein